MLKKIINKIENWKSRRNSDCYAEWLRRKGCKIGDHFQCKANSILIDVSRPSLVEIGDHVRIGAGFSLYTHDFSAVVLRNVYNEFIASSGKVKIGNNVYFGHGCMVLKNTEIGDNCIIGAGSIVTKSIQSDSVAFGMPAKVVSTLDDYYKKRKQQYVEESKIYARSIKERFGRQPVQSDFWEEFPLFLLKNELPNDIPVKKQLAKSYSHYREFHKPTFKNFDDFLEKANAK